jgi:hypothetical protein
VFDELLGRKLCDVKERLGEKYRFVIVLTRPPREEQIITDDARILRVKKQDDETVEIVVANYTF